MNTNQFKNLTQLAPLHKKILSSIDKNSIDDLASLLKNYPTELKPEFLTKLLTLSFGHAIENSLELHNSTFETILPYCSAPVKSAAFFECLTNNYSQALKAFNLSTTELIEFFNQEDSFEQTQLHTVLFMSDSATGEAVLQYILERGIENEIKFQNNTTGENILHISFVKNLESIVSFYSLINKNLFTSFEKNTGYAPVHYLPKASVALLEKTLPELDRHNIDIHFLNRHQNSLLTNLARQGQTASIDLLIKRYGKDKILHKETSKHLVLHAAVAQGQQATSLYLLEQGANPWVKNVNDLDVFWLACRFYEENTQVFEAILSRLTPEKVAEINTVRKQLENGTALKNLAEDMEEAEEVDNTNSPVNIFHLKEEQEPQELAQRDYISVLAEHAPLLAIQKALAAGIEPSQNAHKTLTNALRSTLKQGKEEKVAYFLKEKKEGLILKAQADSLYQKRNKFSFKKKFKNFFLLQMLRNTSASKAIESLEEYQKDYKLSFTPEDWGLALCHAINNSNSSLFRYIVAQNSLETLTGVIKGIQFAEQKTSYAEKELSFSIKDHKKFKKFLKETKPDISTLLTQLTQNVSNSSYFSGLSLPLFLHDKELFMEIQKNTVSLKKGENIYENNSFIGSIASIYNHASLKEMPELFQHFLAFDIKTQTSILNQISNSSPFYQIDFTAFFQQSEVPDESYDRFLNAVLSLDANKKIEFDAERQSNNFDYLLASNQLTGGVLFKNFLFTNKASYNNSIYEAFQADPIKINDIGVDYENMGYKETVRTNWSAKKIKQFYSILAQHPDTTPEALRAFAYHQCNSVLSNDYLFTKKSTTNYILENLQQIPLEHHEAQKIQKLYDAHIHNLNLSGAHKLLAPYQHLLQTHNLVAFESLSNQSMDSLDVPKTLKELNTYYQLGAEFLSSSVVKSLMKASNTYNLHTIYEKLKKSELQPTLERECFERQSEILPLFFSNAYGIKEVFKMWDYQQKIKNGTATVPTEDSEESERIPRLSGNNKILYPVLEKMVHKIYEDPAYGAKILKHSFPLETQTFLEQQYLLSQTQNKVSNAAPRKKLKI